jgi:putative PIN family toxin of toxin-antitoxin system
LRPPRLVVDTNVVVSGFLSADPQAPPGRILSGMLAGRIPFLLSQELLSEYREVLLRAKVQRLHGLSPSEVETVLDRLRQHGTDSPAPAADGAPDPGDAHLWALLAAHPEAVLVT